MILTAVWAPSPLKTKLIPLVIDALLVMHSARMASGQ